MENITQTIEEKIERLPIVSINEESEFQKVIYSDDFNDIFKYCVDNFLPDVLKDKAEVYQRISLYLSITNQSDKMVEDIDHVLYKRPVPSIEEFLTNKFYMGYSNATLYNYWKEQLEDIFKKGSPIRKVIFSGCIGCLTSDTIIATLNGDKTICELLENFSDEWVLSYNTQKNIWEPDKILDVFYTGNRDVYEITLDNDEKIRCTDNHQFLTRNNKWVSIKDKTLAPGLSMMPYYYKENDKRIYNRKIKSIVYVGKEDVYDITTERNHNFALKCGIIAHNSGKSTVARKAFIYVLYRILCLRYPRAVFNIDNDATIANIVISMTLKQVYETNLVPFVKLMESMPCFQKVLSQRSFENFNLEDPRCPIPFVCEKSTGTIYFPDNIILTCGSNQGHFTGYNVVNSFCDEINEKGVEEAIALLNTLDNRFSSRFQGSSLVFQSVVSSARTTNSAIGEYIRHLPKDDPAILKLSPCLWEVKPDPNFIGDGTTFPVLVGNGSIPSKIITNPGELELIEKNEFVEPAGCTLIHVPTVYKSKFELQLDQSIQDIAGMTTSDNNMVFRDTSRLEDPQLQSELYLEANIHDNVDLFECLPLDKMFELDLNGRWRWRRAANAPRYCFTGDTKVSTLDGKEKTMKDLTEEFNNGIDNWVYSWDNVHGWSIGKVVFAGVTKKGKSLCKIILDNDEEIMCTPDHKFMLRDGSYTEARYLTPNTSLMPLYRKKSKVVSYKAKLYEQIKDNRTEKYLFTHKISSDMFSENKETAMNKARKLKSFVVRHHKDFNAANNNPNNIIYLEAQEHFDIHSKKGYDHLKKLWEQPSFREKMKKVCSDNGKMNGRKDMMNKWHGPNNEEWRKFIKKTQAENGRKCFYQYNKSEKHRKIAREVLTRERKDPEFMRKAMIGRILKKAQFMIKNNIPLTEENWDSITQKEYSQSVKFKTALKFVNGMEEIKELLKNYNHKVKSIEYITLNEDVDLYDLTIDDKYNCHNFALSAGVIVSNCHVDLAGGGSDGQCDAGVCILHKESKLNEITRENETIYVIDLLIAVNAKTKIDIHAIQNMLTNLVIERNANIQTISSDQWNGLVFQQALESSGCFGEVKQLSVDAKLEPYLNASRLIELGQVKVGPCPRLRKELEALVLEKNKVTRTTELKDLCDVTVGAIYNAQLNYNDVPVYAYKEKYDIEKELKYESMINEDNEVLEDFY